MPKAFVPSPQVQAYIKTGCSPIGSRFSVLRATMGISLHNTYLRHCTALACTAPGVGKGKLEGGGAWRPWLLLQLEQLVQWQLTGSHNLTSHRSLGCELDSPDPDQNINRKILHSNFTFVTRSRRSFTIPFHLRILMLLHDVASSVSTPFLLFPLSS